MPLIYFYIILYSAIDLIRLASNQMPGIISQANQVFVVCFNIAYHKIVKLLSFKRD
jgi:hypothetical protein